MNQREEAEMDKVLQGTSSLRPCHFPLAKPGHQVRWNFANLHKCFVCVGVCAQSLNWV